MRKEGRLIVEMLATVPSYMTISIDEMEELAGSFASIFKSIWSSLKLLSSNLLLNLNVVLGSITRDRKWISDSFAAYNTRRQKYEEETVENLKYFRKFYSGEGKADNLYGFGPKFLAFAANPLLFVAAETGTSGTTPSTDIGGASSAPSGTKVASSKISPRLKTALDFFGYEASTRLSEAAAAGSPPRPKIPTAAEQEAKKLTSIASDYVQSERKHAAEVLGKLAGRMLVIRQVVEAKNFDELITAIQGAEKQGIKMFDSGIRSAKEKIEAELVRQQKEDPKKFAETIKSMREKLPEIQEPDDVKAALQFSFAVSKSKIQGQLMKSYDSFSEEARRTIVPEIDEKTRTQLAASRVGSDYLRMLGDFEQKLRTGEAESETVKKSFKR